MVACDIVDHADLLESNVAEAVLAIGRTGFPSALMNAVRRMAGADHCMVFSFAANATALCLLDVGDIPTGPVLGESLFRPLLPVRP
jgi:hypothetical protein